MKQKKQKPYEAPSMRVYEIEPTQILAGSICNSTLVNDWEEGVDLGSYDAE